MKTMKQKRLEARARSAWRAERTSDQQLTLINQRKGISHRESLRLLADIALAPDCIIMPVDTIDRPHLKAKDRRRRDRNQKGH